MPRLKLIVAYVGTDFAGWQIQESSTLPRPRTVQGELEKAVARVSGVQVRVHGAGRTDSGVHADAQVAHLDVPASPRPVNWLRAFERFLPPDLSVMQVEEAPESFHARFDATGKEYAYALWLSRPAVPPRLKPFVWACGPVHLPSMLATAKLLVGRHDFASFRNAGSASERTVRTIHSIRHESPAPELLVWHFQADGFLKQMVRNLMGLLVHAGKRKILPAAVPAILAAAQRASLPAPTAPAQGLTLTQVFY
jgi:tRNA pseudouridine38-40 synthase